MLRTTLLVAVLSLASFEAIAKGGPHSSGPITHVGGYAKSNGTYVAPYDRAAPGYGIHGGTAPSPISSDGLVNGGPMDLNDETSVAGVGKQEDKTARVGCEYKGVMTDDEIAVCKAAAMNAMRSPRGRHK